MMDIIEMDQLEESQLKSFFNHYWHDDCMIVSSGVYHLSKLPGFVCVVEEKVYGILTYAIRNTVVEIISINNIEGVRGVGSKLLKALELKVQASPVEEIQVITTNDNLRALGFFQKHGYELEKIMKNAVNDARRIKPSIPLLGDHQIPIKHEILLFKAIK
ncbi:GNAT family N-acetyltransferase [Staphylococcus coagulans]|nr:MULTISPECIES: GNAT family N-acetyltransferase [Staphylococcus]NHA36620.1 GNAT family N-acetyltransferase [Staphylococcus schleiferi]MBT2830220.1 GNAT family N-acetyltransferase [Staphylococcus coagulans]MBT2860049.1 GNAT family N-acetyltransferase [Staphylococcus coagulans]MBU3873327.1 GNAT family N-acetyltransferase [Staphylococcus coagulans]NHB72688.1 GNAT family N-acetyltransferase [Staphylococcus sp. 191]